MKKIIILTAILGTVAFGAENIAPTQKTAGGAANVKNAQQGKRETKKRDVKKERTNGSMVKFLSEQDQATLTKNRNEIYLQKNSENPDWAKVEKLNEESAVIMSRGRVAMLKDSKEKGELKPRENKGNTKQEKKVKKNTKENKAPTARMTGGLSEQDKATLTKNREEIRVLTNAENPDWNAVQRLSDESAVIMSRGMTEMMKSGKMKRPTKTMKKAN